MAGVVAATALGTITADHDVKITPVEKKSSIKRVFNAKRSKGARSDRELCLRWSINILVYYHSTKSQNKNGSATNNVVVVMYG